MKALTINLSDDLDQRLDEASRRAHRSPQELVQDILSRRLLLDRFHDLCRESELLANAAGFTSEEQILRPIP